MSFEVNGLPDFARNMPDDNFFFARLNYDVRCLIYSFLDVRSISHPCLGCVLSCRDAFKDTEPFAVQHLNQYLRDVDNVSRQENRRLLTPAFSLSATYAELNCIEVPTQVLAREMNRQIDSICKLLQ